MAAKKVIMGTIAQGFTCPERFEPRFWAYLGDEEHWTHLGPSRPSPMEAYRDGVRMAKQLGRKLQLDLEQLMLKDQERIRIEERVRTDEMGLCGVPEATKCLVLVLLAAPILVFYTVPRWCLWAGPFAVQMIVRDRVRMWRGFRWPDLRPRVALISSPW